MLLVIMHNDENYLKGIMSAFKAKKAVPEARIIEGNNIALSFGQTSTFFGSGLPRRLSTEYDHALVVVVSGKEEADGLVEVLKESVETITLSSTGLLGTVPLNCIEDLIRTSGRRGGTNRSNLKTS